MKLWSGRFDKNTDALTDELNASIGFDFRMYREDIAGSLAHAAMLAKQGIYLATKAMTPLAMALSKQKRFVSDASHELRTPLTIFYSSLDILALEAKSLSPFGQQLIDELQEEADRKSVV